ncbi:MAG TPA: ABC transporter ATP-binding protein, partial [Candidatus Melainabacteria bacterium]|nr:ABC transporter ATP-binding protein [Candidatus Melainabacteria bacterium]
MENLTEESGDKREVSSSLDIVLKQVSKRYAGRHLDAVKELDLHIPQGSFVALLGPSGCGKSTLLNLLGGIDRPTEGVIEVGGLSLQSMGDDQLTEFRLKKLGFIFQFFNLLPTFTLEENVRLPLEIAGHDRAFVDSAVAALLEKVGLSDRRGYLPAQLSGGEMQRTAVARAIVHKPAKVLADEPTGNLDSENGEKVLALLSQIHADLGIPI